MDSATMMQRLEEYYSDSYGPKAKPLYLDCFTHLERLPPRLKDYLYVVVTENYPRQFKTVPGIDIFRKHVAAAEEKYQDERERKRRATLIEDHEPPVPGEEAAAVLRETLVILRGKA